MNRAEHKRRWMLAFRNAVLAVRPDLSGRIDWTDPEYAYVVDRISPDQAAAGYLDRHPANHPAVAS